jgi:microcin C transport system permease protein
MGAYIIRRLLLMIPTVFGIMAVSFPGHSSSRRAGPSSRRLARFSGSERLEPRRASPERRQGDFASQGGIDAVTAGNDTSGSTLSRQPGPLRRVWWRGSSEQFGFDKPPLERFFSMMWDLSALRFRPERITATSR